MNDYMESSVQKLGKNEQNEQKLRKNCTKIPQRLYKNCAKIVLKETKVVEAFTIDTSSTYLQSLY